MFSPVKNFSPLRYPRGNVEQYFAESPGLYPDTIGHTGWDIIGNYGDPIYAMADGIVAQVDTESGPIQQNAIRILTDTQCHLYGHLSEMFVEMNQKVKAGDYIGRMGDSGFDAPLSYIQRFWKTIGNRLGFHPGTHLHISIIPTEPFDSLKPQTGGSSGAFTFQNGMSRKFTYFNNGYQGCIDPSMFFSFPYTFTKTMTKGQMNDDILYMQFILKKQGVLDSKVDVVGYYGELTSAALLVLQKRYKIALDMELDNLEGQQAGPKSCALLSQLSRV